MAAPMDRLESLPDLFDLLQSAGPAPTDEEYEGIFDGMLEELFDGQGSGGDSSMMAVPAAPAGAFTEQTMLTQASLQKLLLEPQPDMGLLGSSLTPFPAFSPQSFPSPQGYPEFASSAKSGDLPEHSSGNSAGDPRPPPRSGSGRARRDSQLSNGGDQKKKRTRNAQQMELNRVAQQKYRERKKHEHEALQTAVDKLAAQVAAFKVLELKANQLEHANVSLQATVQEQGASINNLQQQVAVQSVELSSTKAALASSQELVGRQQTMILDQHARIELQNQVIESLKDQLRDKIDDAMDCVEPGSVCEKLVAAVKAAIYGATGMEDLQDQLDKLPQELVTQICKNIFLVIKETFPELKARCNEYISHANGKLSTCNA